jgi:ketosteroid isomerase-like protein
MLKAAIALACVSLLGVAACQPKVDVNREAYALLAVDREWSTKAATSTNIDSVLDFWTDDARVAMAGQPTVQGKAALREMVKGSLAIPGFKISWTPDSAAVSASGDLGYTYGTNSVTAPDAKGKLTTESGRYITVWRKNAQGRWQCVMDYSTPAPAKTGA